MRLDLEDGFYLFVTEKNQCCDTLQKWEENFILKFDSEEKRQEELEDLLGSQDAEITYVVKEFEIIN